MRLTCAVLCAAAAIVPAACRSAAPPAPLLHPYKVVLLPVEGAKTALAARQSDADVPLALTPEALASRIVESVTKSHVFSEVVVANEAELRAPGVEDQVQAAAAMATQSKADLILRIQVKSARMTDLGPNSSALWSTVGWFLLPLPVWTVDDRTYDTNLAVQAELYDPADPVKPTASVVASSDKQELDLWDRGLSPFVLVLPPAWLRGSDSSVSETLTDRAMRQLLMSLVEELRTREIPSRFEMGVVQEGKNVIVTVGSRRRLRLLRVEAAGTVARSWAESLLREDPDSTPERFSYRRTVELDTKPGSQVRVIAEDESGGREVRTLVIAGGK